MSGAPPQPEHIRQHLTDTTPDSINTEEAITPLASPTHAMVPTVVFLLLGLFVTGALLALLGFRGRRINDHPICRGCQFDLLGIYPEVVTCPECGAGLKREHAVRIGARHRSIPLALLGLFLFLAPTVPIGIVGYAALTGTDVNKYKPLGLLLWESGHATQEQSARIASELINRALTQSLSPDQYTRVIERALQLQADTSRPWSLAWGDLIERAKLDGVLTQSQEELFEAQSLPIEITTRPAARAGSTIPVIIKGGQFRGSTSSSTTSRVSLRGVRINGTSAATKLPPRGSAIDPFFAGTPADTQNPDATIATLSASGPRANNWLSVGNAAEGGFSVEIPKDLPPGSYDLEVDLSTSHEINTGGRNIFVINGFGRNVNVVQGPETPTHVTTRIQVLDDTQAPTPIAPDPATTTSIEAALIPASVSPTVRFINPTGEVRGGGSVTIDFGDRDLPAPIAYDVFIRDGDREQKLGTLTTGKSGPQSDQSGQVMMSSSFTVTINGRTTTSSNRSSADSRRVIGTIEPLQHPNVDVILRPSPAAAENTINQDRYYNQELIFRNVPVQRDPLLQMGEDPFRRLMPQIFQPPKPPARRRIPG